MGIEPTIRSLLNACAAAPRLTSLFIKHYNNINILISSLDFNAHRESKRDGCGSDPHLA